MDEIGRVSLIAVLEKCISQMNKAADGGNPYQPCSHQYEHNHKNKRLHHDDAVIRRVSGFLSVPATPGQFNPAVLHPVKIVVSHL